MAKRTVSIIIPCYNEERRIIKTLQHINSIMELSDFKYEVIVVNDGSTDNTLQEVWTYITSASKGYDGKILTFQKNNGKGYAVRQGLLASRYYNKLILDADHSVQCTELMGLSSNDFRIKGIIAGSRVYEEKQTILRQALGKGWRWLVRWIAKIDGDTQCPFKFCRMPKHFYQGLKVNGFAWDVEMLKRARDEELAEVRWHAVSYYDNRDSKVTLIKAAKMFFELLYIRKNI